MQWLGLPADYFMENDTTPTEQPPAQTPEPAPIPQHVVDSNELARDLYTEFYQASNHVHFNGDQMAVSFDAANPHQQKAWLAVADAVLK